MQAASGLTAGIHRPELRFWPWWPIGSTVSMQNCAGVEGNLLAKGEALLAEPEHLVHQHEAGCQRQEAAKEHSPEGAVAKGC